MAQMIAKDVECESKGAGSFKFNVSAPEFVPSLSTQQSQVDRTQIPLTGYFYPCFQYFDGNNGSWIYVASDQDVAIPSLVQQQPDKPELKVVKEQQTTRKNDQESKDISLPVEVKQKIIKQAEYMLSDLSLLANESVAKHASKDPEGYVPISFVTSLKKLKSLNLTNQKVAQALKSSSKLIVSSDGKKVKRKHPFTEKEKEELQLRTVIAENLPDDHSHQKIEKMFNVAGTIRSIRICQPQEPNRSSKSDVVVSNKLHALIEFDNHESAEKAAEKLTDEGNWRKGMRVRVMLKRSPKSVLKTKKSDFDAYMDDEAHEDSSRLSTSETEADELKKSWSRNRVGMKPKLRPQLQTAHSLPTPTSHSCISCPGDTSAKHRGPRMPDGTRGFTMGRGKPISVPV